MKGLRVAGLARYVAAHPARALDLVRAGWRLRADGWWRRTPYLPLPDERYWEFRQITAFGAEGVATPRDVVAAARWANRQPVGSRFAR